MNHLTDKQLEHWLQSKENFDRDEATYILEHLESCHLCKERLATLQAYYHDLEREIQKKPGEKEQSVASKIYQQRTQNALPENSLIQTQTLPEKHHHSLPVKAKNYLRKHPVGSASVAVGTVLFAALLVFLLPWPSNDSPVYAKVERNVLHVYNQEGEPIWNKIANGLPNEIDSKTEYIHIVDIDGDDTNEVLITGSSDKGKFTQNTLYCYNNNGTLRWKQNPPAPILYDDRKLGQVTTWDITGFFSINAANKGPQLFVTSNSSWFPSVLFELSAKNGEILQTYYHPGYIWTYEVYQNEGNGHNFILLGTTNNTYQKAALAVLNPANIGGHAPLTKAYRPNEISRADEAYYIMFKPSLMNQLYGRQLYNETSRIRITDNGGVFIFVREKWKNIDKSGSVVYTLNKNFRVLEARGSAEYEKIYLDHYNNGDLSVPLTDQYWESLKDSVMYWDDTTSSFIRHSQLER